MRNNLQEFRKNAKLSLQGLGDICGLSKSHVHELEKSEGPCPRLSTAYAIAAVLGKSVYEIWPDTTEIVEETITVRKIITNMNLTQINKSND